MQVTLIVKFLDYDDAENFSKTHQGHLWGSNNNVTVVVPSSYLPELTNDLKNVYGVTSFKVTNIS